MAASVGVLLTLVSSLIVVDIFTPSASALTQSTTQTQYAQVTLVQQGHVLMVYVKQPIVAPAVGILH